MLPLLCMQYDNVVTACLVALIYPHKQTGVEIGSPKINSASRLTEDPSKVKVQWTPVTNVVDVQIYSGNTFSEVCSS